MSIFNIPKEEMNSLGPLLQSGAKKRLGVEGICTLAEADSDLQLAGCIQFAIEQTGEEPVGRLLYLYVLPKYRGKGVGEQLLLAMENSLSKRAIGEARVLLSNDQSELGEYLEDYGFLMKPISSCCFIRLSSVRVEDEAAIERSQKIVSLKDLPGSAARKIYGEYRDIATWNAEGLDDTLSCALTEGEEKGLLLVRDECGYPALSFVTPKGAVGSDVKMAMLYWMTQRMKKEYPITTRLLFNDVRDMTWYNINVGSVKDGTEAVEGILTVEEPQKNGEETKEDTKEEFSDEETQGGNES